MPKWTDEELSKVDVDKERDFSKLRAYTKYQERLQEQARGQISDLETFQKRAEDARALDNLARVFEAIGLSRAHADLYARCTTDEPAETRGTPESIIKFANDFNLPMKVADNG